ncbi:MAG: hypothetical protein IKP51_08830 [Treponema sp.]|nr:hypothetical protein [Treponema sp.]
MDAKRIEKAIKEAKEKIAIKKLEEIGARPSAIQTGKQKEFFVIVETSDTEKQKRVEELKPVCEAYGVDLGVIYVTRSTELEGLE